MLRIGLTGGIACGKSLVGDIARGMGFPVCEADHLAHGAIEPGKPAYREILDVFGSGILDNQDAIDRSKLGRIVFADPDARKKLNAIVHPRVRMAWDAWMNAQAGDCKACIVIVPLLYEAGFESDWDHIVAVVSGRTQQLQRLQERGLSNESALQRLAAQIPVEEKARRADTVIENNGTVEMLKQETKRMLERILEN